MKPFRTLLLTASLLLHAHTSLAAEGYLFVSPQRLELNDKTPTGQLHLVNKSDTEKTYELVLKYYRMNANGLLEEGAADDAASAKPYLRFSPRRVTLAAGDEQYVRVMAKLPPETAEGGYHAHLEFNEVQGAQAAADKKSDSGKKAVSFSVGASYGVAIPVFVDKGAAKATVKLVELKPKAPSGARTGTAQVTLKREGNASSYHLYTFKYIDAAGKEHLASTPARIPVYREADTVTRDFPLSLPEGVVFNGGSLKLTLTTIADTEPTQQIVDEIQTKIH